MNFIDMDVHRRELLVQTFGILGNIISFLVYLAPLPTFRQIYKKKSTLGYQSLPYVFALFSAMLWMYYALITDNSTLLISINSIGCFFEIIYIIVFLFYATTEAKRKAITEIVSLNVCCFGFALVFTLYQFQGDKRVDIVAWICTMVACLVFAAPLSIIWEVIKTRSVEFMPFALSFFLTLSAVVWFFYGFFKGDAFVALPNIGGFLLGVIQMVIYVVVRNAGKIVLDDQKVPEHIINIVMLGGPEVHPVVPRTNEIENKNHENEDKKEEKEQEKSIGPLPDEPARAIADLGPSPIVVCAA